ncbi:uncharacterized protein LOC132959451 [Labrus mixtus]|uniref:uncharacterized protein LOC132959451 n=1 Tax=Labrus mixtus TaxID=508554 RepID=UPI0029BFC96C|nr:uncharacterized protein LOC132959451 [Labrus mixtus]
MTKVGPPTFTAAHCTPTAAVKLFRSLSRMGRRKLLFVLLLMLTLYVDSKASLIQLEKTTGRESNVTPICSNSTMSIITLIICKVRMEMSPGEECLLVYRHGGDFEHKCNPRVRLKKENEAIFLDLTSLTPVDSGIYTCECSRPTRTQTLQLNITVKATSEKSCGRKLNETDAEETLAKTIGREPDVTPLCSNDTEYFISLIICKSSTKRRRGNESCLSYRHEIGFENKCESGVKLLTENQTVFLQLSSLTPEDEGSYACDCSCGDGTYTTHLNVTVEEPSNDNLLQSFHWVFIAMTTALPAFIIITGIMVGCTLRKKSCRNNTRSEASGLSVQEAPCSLDRGEPDNLYESLQQPLSDLYQTISSVHHPHDAKSDNTATAHQEIDDTEIEQWEDYENL